MSLASVYCVLLGQMKDEKVPNVLARECESVKPESIPFKVFHIRLPKVRWKFQTHAILKHLLSAQTHSITHYQNPVGTQYLFILEAGLFSFL